MKNEAEIFGILFSSKRHPMILVSIKSEVSPVAPSGDLT